MKRYKVKFSNEKTDKHEATRSYDEQEMIRALLEEISYLKKHVDRDSMSVDPEEQPLPTHKFRVYDRKKIAEV